MDIQSILGGSSGTRDFTEMLSDITGKIQSNMSFGISYQSKFDEDLSEDIWEISTTEGYQDINEQKIINYRHISLNQLNIIVTGNNISKFPIGEIQFLYCNLFFSTIEFNLTPTTVCLEKIADDKVLVTIMKYVSVIKVPNKKTLSQIKNLSNFSNNFNIEIVDYSNRVTQLTLPESKIIGFVDIEFSQK